jgi:hypothetical protein
MEVKTDTPPANPLFDPLASWQAAAEWNASAYEWMTRGWKQWWSLMTAPFGDVVTPNFAIPEPVSPAKAGAQRIEHARAARDTSSALDSRLRGSDDKPAARAKASGSKSKRTARPKKAGAKSRVRG